MLALSIKQPWAELIVAGRKNIEVRMWRPPSSAFGALAIHAGKSIATAPLEVVEAANDANADWKSNRGGVIGVARLIDAWELTHERFDAQRAAHLNPLEWWQAGLIAWEFGNVYRLERMVPCRGKLGLFELPADVTSLVRSIRWSRTRARQHHDS